MGPEVALLDRMWMLCPGEPKDAQEKVDVSGMFFPEPVALPDRWAGR